MGRSRPRNLTFGRAPGLPASRAQNRSSMTRDPLAAGDLIAERRFVYAKPSGNGRRNRSQNYWAFDAVISLTVIHNIPSREGAIRGFANLCACSSQPVGWR